MMTSSIIYRGAAIVLLIAAGANRLFITHRPQAVENYHAAIRQAAILVPQHIGPWVAVDVPVPARAIKLLEPNVLISRRYTNVENSQAAGFTLVHCADAHDMVGHYPLRCYPAAGWDLQSSRELPLRIGDRNVIAMDYVFTMKPGTEDSNAHTITVINLLLRPDGQILRDMDALSKSIMGASGQASGAGQVQIYFYDDPLAQEYAAAIAEVLLTGYVPVINAILANVPG
jgi:Protein of unknown function (DUF3485)